MAKHWSEPLDPKRHLDFSSSTVGGRVVHTDPHSRLRGERITQPIHSSSTRPIEAGEHYWQRWYERLPKGLTRDVKRERVVAALDSALTDFGRGSEARHGS